MLAFEGGLRHKHIYVANAFSLYHNGLKMESEVVWNSTRYARLLLTTPTSIGDGLCAPGKAGGYSKPALLSLHLICGATLYSTLQYTPRTAVNTLWCPQHVYRYKIPAKQHKNTAHGPTIVWPQRWHCTAHLGENYESDAALTYFDGRLAYRPCGVAAIGQIRVHGHVARRYAAVHALLGLVPYA